MDQDWRRYHTLPQRQANEGDRRRIERDVSEEEAHSLSRWN